MPIGLNNKKDEAYQLIKRAIISGELKSGELYNILELSEKIGVSKTPTREALVVLAFEGLINPIPRSGYMISPVTVRDVVDVFHLRMIIEAESIGLAVDRITEEDICTLEKNNQKEQEVLMLSRKNASIQSYLRGYELNNEFHLTIARASGNLRIVRLTEQLLVEIERILARDPFIADHQQHAGILDALKKRDRSAAQEAMKEHLEETKSRLLGRF